MMDANALSQKDKRFNQWIRDHNLIDPHTQLYGTRIDYFLTTGDIMDYVSAVGILPFHEYYESNHRAMFLDVNLAEYLKGLPSHSTTEISSSEFGRLYRYNVRRMQIVTTKYLRASLRYPVHQYGVFHTIIPDNARELTQKDFLDKARRAGPSVN
jgi:hypothetical protein